MSDEEDLRNKSTSSEYEPETFPVSEDDFKQIISKYEKKLYDLQQLLEISRSLCTTLDLSTLIQSILYIAMAQMRVLGAGMFVRDSIESRHYKLGDNYSGLEVDTSMQYVIDENSFVVKKLGSAGRVFMLDELVNECPDEHSVRVIASLNPSLVVPLILKNHLNGVLLLGERISIGLGEDAEYTLYERDEILTISSLAAVAVNNASLVEQSSTDMMTHLKLKYYFFNVLTDKLDVANVQEQHLSVVMFDIDFFKTFNDTYGHACGDYVLQKVAKLIKDGIRSHDMAARYGGEEFVVMLANTNKNDALAVAERIRKAVESFDFFYDETHMQVTISGGVSTFSAAANPLNSAKVLVDQADQALYVSKRNGRNRITYADPSILVTESVSS
ncbi:MAG: sensor domain-containing diguanylate cyclase [Treponema sp.]|nr:sensor domain-containing diguanylate cyclase [Treponema sp.]